MIYSYQAKKTANSTVQIITGSVKEVKDTTIVVNVPSGLNKSVDLEIEKTSLPFGDMSVGAPITAIGNEDGEGAFVVDDELQAKLSSVAPQFTQFSRYKENKTTKAKSLEHDALIVFPLRKVGEGKKPMVQIVDNPEAGKKKHIQIPAYVGNNIIWLNFYENNFNHFDKYQSEGKTRMGMKDYAQMLQKKIDGLAEGEILLVPYAGRFEEAVKDAEGKFVKNQPVTPREYQGKNTYSVFGNGEIALQTMLNTSVIVDRKFIPLERNGQQAQDQNQAEVAAAVEAVTASAVSQEPEMTEEEEMELLQAMS